MADILNFINNPTTELIVTQIPKPSSNVLIYNNKSGKFKTLIPDEVIGGMNSHEGNPIYPLTGAEILTSVANSIVYTVENKQIISPNINKGILKSKIISGETNWYWDEEFTTPLGIYTFSDITAPIFNFISSNVLKITLPSKAIPKVGDVLVLQKTNETANSVINNNYILGVSDLKVINSSNSRSFSFTIINNPVNNNDGTFSLTFDKEIKNNESGIQSGNWSVILLNRGSYGIQQGLFNQTFQQYEIWRNKALGDQISNNQYNYSDAIYLGLQNLLSEILPNNENVYQNPPFLVLDIDQEIKDRIYIDSTHNFQISLGNIMDSTKNLILKNSGIKLNLPSIGDYFSLINSTDISTTPKILGYILCDLRIIVITDAELTLALSYNSNRNYLLEKPILDEKNLIANTYSNLNANIININIVTVSGTNYINITTDKNHGITGTTNLLISEMYIEDNLGNYKLSNFNGERLVHQVINEKVLQFAITIDGTFQQNNGVYGKIDGIQIPYNYFMTYAPKSDNYYDVILPYGELINFNINNEQLIINSPININDNFYIIIGKWASINNKVTGIDSIKIFNTETSNTINLNDTIYNSKIDYDISNLFKPVTNPNLSGVFSTQKWFIGNVSFYTELNVYRGNIEINIPSGFWNSTNNPSYVSGSKYISELAIVSPTDNTPLIYTKICPAIEKRNDLDLQINLSLDF